ncbi:MAG: tRNA 2-thiocytidine(32) synthetase TtcA [Christensenellaceae bacterium]|nr:tRNA 2-thiocytidine(32) synthetase TtcA [Christensenellaceae bacterium]MDD6926721.1 ATP-binding protein [bacterium]
MELQKLLSPARRIIDEYNMIQDGDKIAVGLSGGKDSVTLLYILASLRKFYPKKFDLMAITVDMGLKDMDENEKLALKKLCEDLEVEYKVIPTDIAEIIFDVRKESNPCSLCAKMRRGALNNAAIEAGCNKLALGHHADDLIETLFLSLFYEGRLSTFSPVSYMDRTGITLIRPMLYIEEKDIRAFAKDKPILHNTCPADKHTQRQYIKDMLNDLKKDIPFLKHRIHGAITHPERNNLFDKCLIYKTAPAGKLPETNKTDDDKSLN